MGSPALEFPWSSVSKSVLTSGEGGVLLCTVPLGHIVLFKCVDRWDAARGSMGKISKKALLNTEVFLLNFLLTYVTAGTKPIVTHAVNYWDPRGMTWLSSSHSFQMRFQKLPIIWQVWHLKQSLFFFFILPSQWMPLPLAGKSARNFRLQLAFLNISNKIYRTSRPVEYVSLLLAAVLYFCSSTSVSIFFFNVKNFHNSKKGTKFMWQQW